MKRITQLFLNEPFILVLIIVNALVIFTQQFGIEKGILDYLDIILTLAFIFEAAVKIRVYSWRKYIKDSWNRFDFILVVISLPSLATIFVETGTHGFSILLALRVFRVFKAFRIIKFLPDIEELIESVKRAIKTSYVIGIGFFILIFIVSLVSCAMYKTIAPEYFGNPVQSIYSIFQLFSVEGWYEIPDLIAERSSTGMAFFAKLYFSSLLLIGGIMGLSLVNSIFVDAMVSDNNDELENQVKELQTKIDKLIEIQERNK